MFGVVLGSIDTQAFRCSFFADPPAAATRNPRGLRGGTARLWRSPQKHTLYLGSKVGIIVYLNSPEQVLFMYFRAPR